MHRKIRVAVICGGQSPEHEISLSSGRTVTEHLDRSKYLVKPMCIRRDGSWLIPQQFLLARSSSRRISSLFSTFGKTDLSGTPDGFELLCLAHAMVRMERDRIECAVIMLHGKGGEDGTLQGLFDMMQLPYTCSGVLASSLGMDKIRCQRVLASSRLKIPRNIPLHLRSLKSINWTSLGRKVRKEMGFPCFVKPSRTGSSVGVGIAHTPSELRKRISTALNHDRDILLEELVQGTEVSCGVLDIIKNHGTHTQIPLAPTEIVPTQSAFFDYEAKYKEGMSEEITPARLPGRDLTRIQKCALTVHNLIGCAGMSRVDMILRRGALFVLEINTIPGMTPLSLVPQGAAAIGINYSRLLEHLIRHALWLRGSGT